MTGGSIFIDGAGGCFRLGKADELVRMLSFVNEAAARAFLKQTVREAGDVSWLRQLLRRETGVATERMTHDEVLDRVARLLVSGQWYAATQPTIPTAPGEALQIEDEPIVNVQTSFKREEPVPVERTWIEIELLDEADQPVAEMEYWLRLVDGTVRHGRTDHRGLARYDGIEGGVCEVSFPGLDKGAWGEPGAITPTADFSAAPPSLLPEPPPAPEPEVHGVVVPKIEAEYAVAVCHRRDDQDGSRKVLAPPPTYLELSLEDRNPAVPFDGTGTLRCQPKGVRFFADDACSEEVKVDTAFSADELRAKKKLYVQAPKAPGLLKIGLELSEPDDPRVKRERETAVLPFARVSLELSLFAAHKAAETVLVDPAPPAHELVPSPDWPAAGRVLMVQDGSCHGRAKLVVRKPDHLWEVGGDGCHLVLEDRSDSGAVKVFTAEQGGVEKPLPIAITKNDFARGDLELWVEGGSETDALGDACLALGLDRADGGLPKQPKPDGDFARFTVVALESITPDAERVQYVNFPPDAAEPSHGREIQATAKLTRPLEGVELAFALVPHRVPDKPEESNRADLPDRGRARVGGATAITDGTGTATSPSEKLVLSGYGGDRFRVTAYPKGAPPPGLKAAEKACSKELTNRKKVFYTLTFMQAPGGGNYGHAVDEDAFRKGFEPAFIDLERVGEPRIVPHVEVFDRPSWIGENFPPAADRTMNIGLVDSITQNPVELTVRFTPEAVEDVFPIDKKGLVFDLGHGIKHATVAIRKRSKRGPCQPYVTLKGDAESGYEIHTRAGVIATKGKVALEDLEIEVALLGYNCASGISTGSATLCAVAHKERDYPERMEDVVRRTLAHEAGHYLGIATRFSPHLTSELNVRYYDETYHVGGIGPHCSFPERIVESNALPATPGCVMYHSHADALDFCPDCVEALRLRQNTGGRIDGRREPF